jgi:hypothetical protein
MLKLSFHFDDFLAVSVASQMDYRKLDEETAWTQRRSAIVL